MYRFRLLFCFFLKNYSWREISFSLLCFGVLTCLFVLGISHDTSFLRDFGANIIWICSLCVFISPLSFLCKDDYTHGFFTLMRGYHISAGLYIFSKITAYWVCSLVWIIPGCLIIGHLFGISFHHLLSLVFSLTIGSFSLSQAGMLCALLTVSSKEMLTLGLFLVFPFVLPPLFLGLATSKTLIGSSDFYGHLAAQLGMLCIVFPASLWIVHYIIKELESD